MPGGGHLPRGRGPRGDAELHSQKRRLLRVTTPVAFQSERREKLRPLALLSEPRSSEKTWLLSSSANKGVVRSCRGRGSRRLSIGLRAYGLPLRAGGEAKLLSDRPL